MMLPIDHGSGLHREVIFFSIDILQYNIYRSTISILGGELYTVEYKSLLTLWIPLLLNTVNETFQTVTT